MLVATTSVHAGARPGRDNRMDKADVTTILIPSRIITRYVSRPLVVFWIHLFEVYNLQG